MALLSNISVSSDDFSGFDQDFFGPDPDQDVDGFLPGDWRNQLNNWIYDNCSEPDKYLKIDPIYFQMIDFLSNRLAHINKRGITESQARLDIGWCGKRGERQINTITGEKRFLGHYCNHRDVHLPCAIRYRRGQGVALRDLFSQIINSTNCWGFYSWTFTITGQIREWLDKECFYPADYIRDIRRAIARTVKRSLGVTTKERDLLPGFSIIYHPVSSSNPFKKSAHFHVVILPVIIKRSTQELVFLPKRINHHTVKKHYKQELDKVLHKYGIQGEARDSYVVHLHYAEIENKREFKHIFKYVNRSAVEDIIRVIKRTTGDFSEFLGVFWDQEKGLFIPKQINLNELLIALISVLTLPVPVRVSYGFLRVIDRYTEVLGLQQEEPAAEGEWEKIYDIIIKRILTTVYDDKQKKIKRRKRVFICEDNGFSVWVEIDPLELVGEGFYTEKRARYKQRGP